MAVFEGPVPYLPSVHQRLALLLVAGRHQLQQAVRGLQAEVEHLQDDLRTARVKDRTAD